VGLKHVHLHHSKAHSSPALRPLSKLEIFDSSKSRSVTFSAVLVDTGADYLMLPRVVATRLGYNLTVGRKVTVRGATGASSGVIVSGCNIEIESVPLTVDILFNNSGSSPPLIGRNAIFALKDLAIDASEWHWP